MPTILRRPAPLIRRRRRFMPSNGSGALVAGSAAFVSSGPGGISVTATDASGGTPAYTYQWERNEDGGAFANLGGETALSCTDETATLPDVLYGYRLKYTDSAAADVTSNTVTAEVYSGGALGAGVGVAGLINGGLISS